MPQYYVYGDKPVSESSFLAASDAQLRTLAASAPSMTRRHAFAPLLADRDDAALAPRPASPIGIGKPLSVEIAYVYTGVLSRNDWRRSDLLVTSAVKRLPVFDAAPRAMQALLKSVPEYHGFDAVPANTPGSPLVYHSPALTDRGVTVTVEMTFDRFPSEAFDQIGGMLAGAAGIPVFAPASAYLMAASIVVKLFSKVAEAIIDGRPSFTQSLSVNVDRPLYEDTSPGALVLTGSGALDASVDKGHLRVDLSRGLVDARDQPYRGPDAYMIATLDGSDRPDYANFTPTLASAAILDRYFHTGENRPTPTGLMLDALKAYNDIHFRTQADSLRKRLASLPDQNSEEAKKLKQLIDAYVKNIGNDDLKPKP